MPTNFSSWAPHHSIEHGATEKEEHLLILFSGLCDCTNHEHAKRAEKEGKRNIESKAHSLKLEAWSKPR